MPSSSPALIYDVVGSAPGLSTWGGVLHTLSAWPSPETITVERRIVRCPGGLREQIQLGSELGTLLDDAVPALEGLARPLRFAAALRQRSFSVAAEAAPTVAVLPDLGSGAPMFVRGLADDVLLDLKAMPVGSGIALCAWNLGPLDPDAAPVQDVLTQSMQRKEVATEGPFLGGAARVWSSGPLEPALLARLAALAGLPGERWQYAEDADRRVAQRDASVAGAPPVVDVADERDEVRVASAHYMSNLFAYAPLSPLADERSPRIGRPYSGRLPREGTPIGRVLTTSGTMRELRVPWSARRRHTLVCGATGSGKSELLVRLAVDDVRSGRGLVLLDPHGDVADRVLGAVPAERRDEVVLIEPCHPETAALPVLAPNVDPEAQVALVDDLFCEIHDLGRTYNSGRWRRVGRLALEMLGALEGVDPTFAGLDRMMVDGDVRAGVTAALPDGRTRRQLERMGRWEWDRGTHMGTTFVESAARYAFDHASRWDADDAVQQRRIVIAKLELGRLGSHDTGRIGRMLLRLVFNALTGSARPDGSISIVVDEAHLFGGGPVLGALLAQARKFDASLTLCTQAPSRLGPGLLTDILTNCGAMLALQLPEREARVLAERDAVAAEAVPGLPVWHAAASLDGDVAAETPLVIHPIAPVPHDGDAADATVARARSLRGRTPGLARRGDVMRFAALHDRLLELGWGADRVARFAPIAEVPEVTRQELVAAALAGAPLPEPADHDDAAPPAGRVDDREARSGQGASVVLRAVDPGSPEG